MEQRVLQVYKVVVLELLDMMNLLYQLITVCF